MADKSKNMKVPEFLREPLETAQLRLAEFEEGAHELRGKAESFRSEAMEKLEELQAKAVAYLGVATREQVLELSRELERLSRRLEKSGKPTRSRKAAKRQAAEG